MNEGGQVMEKLLVTKTATIWVILLTQWDT